MPAGGVAQAHISSFQIDATGGGKFRSLKQPTDQTDLDADRESSRRLSRRSGRSGCAVCAPLDSLGYRFCARPQAEPSTSGNRRCRLTARPCAADKSGSDRWQQCQAQPRQRREIRGIGSSQSSSWLLSRKFQTSLGHRGRLFDYLVGGPASAISPNGCYGIFGRDSADHSGLMLAVRSFRGCKR
jgi:hypothetical protein